MSSDSDDGPNYAALQPPDDKPPTEYSYIDRRAEIYRMIEEAGHPHNLERSQRELGERYGVSQKQISKDIARIREFERSRNGSWARSTTSWMAEKAVMEQMNAARELAKKADDRRDEDLRQRAARMWRNALDTQMTYNQFLFQLGELEEAPDEIHFEGDPGELYMEMLRQQADKE